MGAEAPAEWVPDMSVEKPSGWDDEEDGVWERPLIKKPLPSKPEVFARELVNSITDGCPWLLLGLVVTAILQGITPSEDTLRQHLGGSGFGVIGKGAVLGLASPLCSCGALPLAMGLAGAGAAPSAIVSFIVAAQSAGIDSLFFTLGVLGPQAAAVRMIAAAVIAMVSGAATPRPKAIAAPQRRKEDKRNALSRVKDGLKEAVTTSFDELVPSVGLGFALTAAITAFLPAGGLASASALGGAKGRAAVLLLAVPLQFCEHAAVPLAAALRKAGASGGLAFAVLATMPSMNLTSYGVVANVSGVFGAVRVAAAVWFSGFAVSFIADWAGFDVVQVGHGDAMLPEWYELTSKVIMAAVLAGAVVRWIKILVAPAAEEVPSCCAGKQNGKME